MSPASLWPMFEADASKRAEWLAMLTTWHQHALHDVRLWPWRRDLRVVAERLERVIAAYQGEPNGLSRNTHAQIAQ